jgi:hypothetical protein
MSQLGKGFFNTVKTVVMWSLGKPFPVSRVSTKNGNLIFSVGLFMTR